MSIYTENGYANRKEYLDELREEYGDLVNILTGVLPSSEDFDGLVTALEDALDSGQYEDLMWHFKHCPRGTQTLLWCPILNKSTQPNIMGTRSRIGIQLPDHSVVSTYCHWDGYPKGNGVTLVEHYQNREDVQELIDGGSMSSLRTRGTWNHDTALRDENGEYINDAAGYLMYENDREPQPLYHSERGDGEDPSHTSFDKFVSGDSGEEYAYMFDLNGNWKAYKINYKEPVEIIEIPNYVTA